jgi:thiamine biosynthesis protein ThiS
MMAGGVIRVNDRDEMPWQKGLTVSDVLRWFGYTYARLVVKVDGDVVAPEEYDGHAVPFGADVRVIHLLGGG